MKAIINKIQAVDMLLNDEYASWGYEEAEAIVDYLEEYEADNDCEIEFDPIIVRSTFTKYRVDDMIEELDIPAPDAYIEDLLGYVLGWLTGQGFNVVYVKDDTIIVCE